MNRQAESLTCDYCGLPIPPPAAWYRVISWRSMDSSPRAAAETSVRREPGEQIADHENAARPTSQYCCFGCRFAAEVTRSKGEHGAATWALTRLGLAVFFTMNVMAFTMALWSRDLYSSEPGSTTELAASVYGLFRFLCMILALPVLLLL